MAWGETHMPGLHQKLGHLGGLATASVAWSKLPTENPPCFFGGKPHWKSMKTQGFSQCSMDFLVDSHGKWWSISCGKSTEKSHLSTSHSHAFSWIFMSVHGKWWHAANIPQCAPCFSASFHDLGP